MKISHISAECYPVAKVGGLADVVGTLPKYQTKAGDDAHVIMPLYDNEFARNNAFKTIYTSTLQLGDRQLDFEVLTLLKNNLDTQIYFIKIPDLLFVDYVYSTDDSERFLAFQIATLDWMLTWEEKPDIIHCHDHHTGLIPFMLQESYKYETLNNIPNVLTIHNAQYQGWFSHDKVGLIPEFDFSNVGLLDWNDSVNPLAAGIKCAWRVTTVSPSYMEELTRNANGLESLLAAEKQKCVGILNGIDTEVWNPETDKALVKNYRKSNVVSGKKANKKWLSDTFGFDKNKPLFIFIGRLVYEKGAHLLPEIIKKALQENDISILLLGSGNPDIQKQIASLNEETDSNFNVNFGYDEDLSHKMYAGADFLLMPSMVEPCGLNQMYAMRYGSIPVVSHVGGLKDTVVDIDEGGFGFVHKEVSIPAVCQAISRASNFINDKKSFNSNRKYIMSIDHSWDKSAKDYKQLYQSIK